MFVSTDVSKCLFDSFLLTRCQKYTFTQFNLEFHKMSDELKIHSFCNIQESQVQNQLPTQQKTHHSWV